MTIKKLQNGSDIRGVALKIPGGENVKPYMRDAGRPMRIDVFGIIR